MRKKKVLYMSHLKTGINIPINMYNSRNHKIVNTYRYYARISSIK